MTVTGKRAKITPKNEAQIMAYSLSDKYYTMQRAPLAEIMKKEIAWEGQPPEKEVLIRKISEYRNKPELNGPEEKPWAMSTVDDYPIPNDAIPTVLKIWKSRVENGSNFTIREAKWAARLLYVIEDIETLARKASHYARAELLFKMFGIQFDSRDLDRQISQAKIEINNDITTLLSIYAAYEEDLEFSYTGFFELYPETKRIHFGKEGKITLPGSGPFGTVKIHRKIGDGKRRTASLNPKDIEDEGSHNQEVQE